MKGSAWFTNNNLSLPALEKNGALENNGALGHCLDVNAIGDKTRLKIDIGGRPLLLIAITSIDFAINQFE